MIFRRIHRKIHKALHPVIGEIWMLHRVVEQRSEDPKQRELEVTPEWLEQEINDYRAHGWHFVPIDAMPKRGRWVCLTFDDGYQDNYSLAYPLLERLGVPFCLYVTTGFIDNRLPMWWYPNKQLGISGKELKDIDSDPLCTIGAHTVSHPKLDTLSREQQYQEIENSKKELEHMLDHPVKHFSFPHGANNLDTLNICRELGFSTVTQSWGGPLRHREHLWPMPRIDKKQP